MRPFLKLASILKFFSLILFVCFLAVSSEASARFPRVSICSYVLSDETSEQFGKPDPSYNLKRDLAPEKSVVLNDVKPLDQAGYGCCWISSYLGYAGRRECSTIVKDLNPSQTYLAIMSLYERAMHGVRLRKTVSQGGNTPYAVVLAERYGAIPEGVWKPKIDIHQKEIGNHFVDLINLKIAKHVRDSEKLFTKKLHTEEDFKELARLQEVAQDEINDLFVNYLGPIPEVFQYQGKTYTPAEFGKLTLPQDMREMDYIIPRKASTPLRSLVTSKTVTKKSKFTDPEWKTWSTVLKGFQKGVGWESIDHAIERSLRSNEPVLFGIGIKRSFIDVERGIISIDAYAKGQEGFLEEIQNAVGAMPSYTDGGHAILITGIYRNKQGKTLGYRIQNSWGEKGDKGYFDMDANYMRTFEPSFFFKKGMFNPQ